MGSVFLHHLECCQRASRLLFALLLFNQLLRGCAWHASGCGLRTAQARWVQPSSCCFEALMVSPFPTRCAALPPPCSATHLLVDRAEEVHLVTQPCASGATGSTTPLDGRLVYKHSQPTAATVRTPAGRQRGALPRHRIRGNEQRALNTSALLPRPATAHTRPRGLLRRAAARAAFTTSRTHAHALRCAHSSV